MWTAEAPSFVTPDPEVLGTAGNTCFIRIKGCLCCLLINYFFFSRFFLLFTPRICSHSTLFCKEDDQERDIQANDDDDSEKNSLGCSGCLTEHFTIPLVDHKHKTSCRNTFWQVTQHFMSPTLAYSAQTASEAAPGNSPRHTCWCAVAGPQRHGRGWRGWRRGGWSVTAAGSALRSPCWGPGEAVWAPHHTAHSAKLSDWFQPTKTHSCHLCLTVQVCVCELEFFWWGVGVFSQTTNVPPLFFFFNCSVFE